MSWQAYADYLVNTYPDVDGAALVGHAGGVWAVNNIAWAAGEDTALNARFTAFNNGAKINVGGVAYMATGCTPDQLAGRKAGQGIVVMKSTQCFIVVHHSDGGNVGTISAAAGKMQEDLISKGF